MALRFLTLCARGKAYFQALYIATTAVSVLRLAPPVVVVHGGAGRWRTRGVDRERVLEVVAEAAHRGFTAAERGDALDAVVEAVRYMEDSGVLNAGMGSVLNLAGYVEMDAGVMDGARLRGAGVAAVRSVRNPVVLARVVLEHTDHVLMVGEGAERIAEFFALEKRGETPRRVLERYRELLKNLDRVPHWSRVREFARLYGVADTVGAVAMDRRGNLAAATSTGGVWLKLPGRVGDSPILGAGYYAENGAAAASATGLGEYIVVYQLCRRVVDLVKSGASAPEAAEEAMEGFTRMFGGGTAGVIVVDHHGYVAAAFNTEAMPRAVAAWNLPNPVAVFSREEKGF